MQTSDVVELAEKLRAAGCIKAKVAFNGKGDIASLDVEFAEGPAPAATFVDASGKPLDLDAGLPELAKDPDGPLRGDDEPSDAAIEQANFRGGPRAKAS